MINKMYKNQYNFLKKSNKCYKNIEKNKNKYLDKFNNINKDLYKIKEIDNLNKFIKKYNIEIDLNEYKKCELDLINKILYKNNLDNIETDNSKILNFIGLIYYHKYNNEYKAEEYYKKALSIDDNNKDANYNIGNLYMQNKFFVTAEIYIFKAVKLNNNLALDSYAYLLDLFGKYEKAEIYYLKAININNNIHTIYNYARFLYKIDKIEEAKIYLLKAIKFNILDALEDYKNIIPNIFDKYNNLKKINSELAKIYIRKLEKSDVIKKYNNTKKIDECFICYNDNIEVIEYKCNNKHYLCKDCYFLVNRCPYCRL